MAAWRRLLALSPADRRLVRRSAVLLALTRVGLWVLPFRLVRALLNRYARAAKSPPGGADAPDRIGWAVVGLARRGPAMTCLVQALVADAMLRRQGFTPELRIGVRPGDSRNTRPFESHAWVECGGTVVVGDAADLREYQVLAPPAPSAMALRQRLVDRMAALLRGQDVPWTGVGAAAEQVLAFCHEEDLDGLTHQSLSATPNDWPVAVTVQLSMKRAFRIAQ